jgi:hypothetical protein
MFLLRRRQRKKERVGQVGFLIVKRYYAYPFLEKGFPHVGIPHILPHH